ncbi:MAG: hypothetical protein ACRDAM_15415 [Casimicrobium sp.]
MQLFVVVLAACVALIGCQPSNPPPTPLPTKEKTIDKVKNDVDQAMKKAQEVREEAEKRDSEDPMKKGY